MFRHSPFRGATFAVHLACGDSVNDQHDNKFWMSVTKLATKARCSRRAASAAVVELVDAGFLRALKIDNVSGKPNLYQFAFPDCGVIYESRGVLPEVAPPATSGSRGATSVRTNPIEPKENYPPNPPQAGGTDHHGQHERCRSCGTNQRGARPSDPMDALQDAQRARADRSARRERGEACAACLDMGVVETDDGVVNCRVCA